MACDAKRAHWADDEPPARETWQNMGTHAEPSRGPAIRGLATHEPGLWFWVPNDFADGWRSGWPTIRRSRSRLQLPGRRMDDIANFHFRSRSAHASLRVSLFWHSCSSSLQARSRCCRLAPSSSCPWALAPQPGVGANRPTGHQIFEACLPGAVRTSITQHWPASFNRMTRRRTPAASTTYELCARRRGDAGRLTVQRLPPTLA